MIDMVAVPAEKTTRRRAALGVWLALTVAALFAAAGARLGWTAAADLPSGQQMGAIADTVLPGAAWSETRRHEDVAGSPDSSPDGLVWGYGDYGAGSVTAELTGGPGDLAVVATRLEAAGWRVGEPDDLELTAARDHWRLSVDRDGVIDVERSEPWLATVLSVLFAVAGVLLGWRIRRWIGALGLVFVTPYTLIVAWYLIFNAAARFGTAQFALLWEPLMTTEFRLLTLVGLGLLAVSPLWRGARR
ncbi:hypothetical protein Ade02nite_44780 [Paractinoplanes deccanensis]|uniref:Uncharacterized protein n=1 Tax=Paractinoplanes deccanensis TaxID=113561 RepID=A0ABQ3Y764_9ACTN|nr:hypothetical protein [Actinoplanes deccanensis]GID75837.1 hypothetical protein Ade02nite_44780 [Actinoplanes deccanensis]